MAAVYNGPAPSPGHQPPLQRRQHYTIVVAPVLAESLGKPLPWAGPWLAHLGSVDDAKGCESVQDAQKDLFGLGQLILNFRLGNTVVSHENGGYERIRPHQTAFDALGMRDYIGDIPERAISRKVSLIWRIPA